MNNVFTNFGESFGYVFKDRDWVGKVCMLALFVFLSFFLVGIPFVLGYMVWVTRNVIRREPYPLPEWVNLSDMFVCGLKLIACCLIICLPFWILVSVPMILFLIMGIMEGMAIYFGLSLVFYIIMIVAALAYNLFLIPMYLRFAMTDQVGATVRPGKLWNYLKYNFVNILLTLIAGWLAGMIGGAGSIIMFVGVFFTYAYGLMIYAHFLGKMELTAQSDNHGTIE